MEDAAHSSGVYFKEQDIVKKHIDSLISCDSNDVGTVGDGCVSEIEKILTKYQEQPQILDPSLPTLVPLVLNHLRLMIHEFADERSTNLEETNDSTAASTLRPVTPPKTSRPSSFPFQLYQNPKMAKLFQLIYFFCKVRGVKTILKFFPHEAKDLEPTLALLQCQDKNDYANWESRYVLLLWMSMLCLVPFDLTTIDSSAGECALIPGIINACKSYLSDPGPTKEAAALCLSRLLTRPDMEKLHIRTFLSWVNAVLDSVSSSSACDSQFLITGVLLTLSEISKHAHRQHYVELQPLYVDRILTLATTASTSNDNSIQRNTLQRKLLIKLVQRIGLTLLPPKIMPWRYQRGQRSLLLNLSSQNPTEESSIEECKNEDDVAEVPEQMESVVEILLSGLRDKDTIVRWSAAKGVGRITGRLPLDYADDIVECVLELFTPAETDGAWHGGCLALAELARRGLLLPERLEKTVNVVLQALIYDERRGANSIGAHVRDAACYVCWSFARAYAPEVLKPFVLILAQRMLVTAVFDREINCRRAASAAFQENVGRQGHSNFPNGISILTIADYFTLGNRTTAFVDISREIGKYAAYRYELISHVLTLKIGHWDESIRTLSARALSSLTSLDPSYMIHHVVPTLLKNTLSSELFVRHGSTLALAEVLLALAETPVTLLDGELQKSLRNVVPRIEKARLYRGRGGEIMRGAVCRYIECMANANLELSNRAQVRMIDTLDECIRHPNASIQRAAVNAYRVYVLRYFGTFEDERKDRGKIYEKLVTNFMSHVSGHANVAWRRGYAQALGATPSSLFLKENTFSLVLDTLVQATYKRQVVDEQDAESRQCAIKATVELCTTRSLTPSMIHSVFTALMNGMEDYSTDDRGDVGSWVRMEAIRGCEKFIITLARAEIYGDKTLEDEENNVVVEGFGTGKVVDTYGEREKVFVIDFKDDRESFGYTYFPTKRGIFAASKVSFENASSSTDDEDDEFMLPELSVRRECLASVPTTFLSSASSSCRRHLTAEMVKEFMGKLLQLLSEKLDVVRELAGSTLFRLLHSTNPVVPWIPDRPHMQVIFKDSVNFANANETFPLVCKTLDILEYLPFVTSGLVVSVGGLTESVVKASRDSVVKWFERHLKLKTLGLLATFSYNLITILETNAHDDRVIIPTFKTLGYLLERNLFDFLHKDGPKFGSACYDAVSRELNKSGDLKKIMAGVSLLIGLLPSEDEVVKRTTKGLLVLLGHRFPRVRKFVAEQLYTRFLIHEDLLNDVSNDDEVLAILTETAWDGKIGNAREKRDELYDLFKIPRAAKRVKDVKEDLDKKEHQHSAPQDTENYQHLVKEVGY